MVDTTPAADRRAVSGVTYVASDDAFGNVNRSRNKGLRLATSDYVLLLDDDSEHDRLAAKYHFFVKHFGKRAVKIEFLTDLLLAVLDGRRTP